MRIAALIQVHRRPEQVERLVERLSGPAWAPYIHVDAKSDGIAFDSLRSEATLLRERVAVYWGGLSQVKAALLLMREAYRDSSITHFYHMSGQCYPVKTDDEILSRISAMPVGFANFMTLTAMPVAHKPMYRYNRRAFFDVPNPFVRKVANRLASYLPDKPLNALRGISLFGGSSWWLFERETVRKILEFVDDNPWYLHAFRFSTSPDEMAIHSLIAPLNITVGAGCPTAAKWIQGRANPEIVTEEIHQEFLQSPALFGRKYGDFQPES